MSQEASGLKKDRKNVLQKAFMMASGTLTSRILGLLRDIALAALFERAVTDAWAAAFRLPNFFRRLLGEGSLSVSFIPVFMQAQAEDPHGSRGRNLVNSFYTFLLVVLGLLTALGFFYMESLLGLLLAPGYALDTAKWELTLRLARIMFGFVFLVSTYAYGAGILNALGSFALPALAPALLNISMLVFTFMPPAWFTQYGDGLAWGVLIGGALQVAVVFIGLNARGYLPKLSLKWSQDVQKVFASLIPGLLGMGVMQMSALVNLYFASSLSEGSISYIYWADRLLELPLSLVSVSLGTALLPTLSEYFAKGEREKAGEAFADSFMANFYLAVPACCGLYLLAGPIVEALFFRGQFQHADLLATSAVLQIYAFNLLFMSCVRVTLPLYYASKKHLVPAVVSLVSLAVHIILAPIFMKSAGLEGLIFSSLVAAAVNFLVLMLGLSFLQIAFPLRVLTSMVKVLVAGLIMSGALWAYSWLDFKITEGLRLPVLLVVISVASLIYGFMTLLFKVPEATKIRRLFRL